MDPKSVTEEVRTVAENLSFWTVGLMNTIHDVSAIQEPYTNVTT